MPELRARLWIFVRAFPHPARPHSLSGVVREHVPKRVGDVKDRGGTPPPVEHEPPHVRERWQKGILLRRATASHVDVPDSATALIGCQPTRWQWAPLQAIRQPHQLRVGVQDGDGGFLGDGHVEDGAEKPLRVRLHLHQVTKAFVDGGTRTGGGRRGLSHNLGRRRPRHTPPGNRRGLHFRRASSAVLLAPLLLHSPRLGPERRDCCHLGPVASPIRRRR
mmetsp:Transcript_128929/g.275171  ORF Transcript_128929/g.275171 Transcript_128929/m.275171 type:complete len:220 (-) Transcript_128929:492-1151(-)